VKAGRGKLSWFLSWTHVFTWSILGVKAVWIKSLQPKPRVTNAPFIICLMCSIFPGVHFNRGKIQVLQIKEINVCFHEKDLNRKMHMNEDLDNYLSKYLQE
jgi:hypothetical protein